MECIRFRMAVLEGSRIFHERILDGDDPLSKHANKKYIKEILAFITTQYAKISLEIAELNRKNCKGPKEDKFSAHKLLCDCGCPEGVDTCKPEEG